MGVGVGSDCRVGVVGGVDDAAFWSNADWRMLGSCCAAVGNGLGVEVASRNLKVGPWAASAAARVAEKEKGAGIPTADASVSAAAWSSRGTSVSFPLLSWVISAFGSSSLSATGVGATILSCSSAIFASTAAVTFASVASTASTPGLAVRINGCAPLRIALAIIREGPPPLSSLSFFL